MKAIKKFFGFFLDKSLLPFLIIGGVNTVVSMAGNFALQQYAGWTLFWSSATAFAVTSVPSFYFNRKYSFKSKAPLGPSIMRFAVVITSCFLLSYFANQLVLPWLRAAIWPDIPEILYTFVKVVGIQVVFTALNYVGQRLWAFKEDAPSA